MATTTPNMSLIAWNSSNDSYDHTQLSGNWTKVDAHDHTGGKGVQIPTGGIADGAVTTPKLGDGSVTSAKLSIGAVTADKLDKSYVHPLGSVLLWWRPNNLTSVPTGWVIIQGQTLTPAEHEFPGGGTVALPNADQAYLFLVTSLGSVGSIGGSSTLSLGHTHTVSAHQHTVPSHSHVTAGHSHGYGGLTDLKDAMNTTVQAAGGSLYVHAEGAADSGHSHGYSGLTDPSTDSTNGVALTTDAATSGTGSALGNVTITPPFVGFLPLLRVKL